MKLFSLGLIFYSLVSIAALADSEPAYQQDKRNPDFRLNVGWAVGFGPEFFGSSSVEFKHRPIVDLRYKKRLRIFGPKINYSLFKGSGFSAGPVMHYSFGRKESDNPMLKGLGDNGGRVELGAFLSYKKGPFRVKLEGKSGLGGNAGETLTLSILQGLYRGERISWLVALRSQYFSQQAMQRKFGITDLQSQRSVANLAAFRPSAGLSNSSMLLFGDYKLKDNVSLIVVGSLWRLMADAKNSPLIKSDFGSQFQSLYGMALVYKF